ncbi:hypothetical protein ABEB36_010096 [Hypothenemus hampei]|uniref:Uncharacterized protein n=1 Tax=Hypothenemus hampei TaxID=57062 RepID=A0ABD1EII1_HYPHA
MTTKFPSVKSTPAIPWKFLGSVSSVSPSSFDKEPITNNVISSTIETPLNNTGYYIDDEEEIMWNDLKTVMIACVATLLPLIIALMVVYGLRKLWIQYKTRKKRNHQTDEEVAKENLSLATSKPLHAHLHDDKDRQPDLTATIINTDHCDLDDGQNQPTIMNNTRQQSNVNGSIITMTLKNNHLIVETEERNDIEEDSRETTLHYSPSARNGVFVVEVQQGIRRSPSSAKNPSPDSASALVHNPPEKFDDEESNLSVNPQIFTSFGLSVSNSSLNSSRYSYSYNQYSYDQGNYGYNVDLGYPNDFSNERVAVSSKPKITSAVYKKKSMSFDVDYKGGKEKMVKNNSLDNVLESDGLEDVFFKLLQEEANDSK